MFDIQLRIADEVRRWQTVRLIKEQNLAQHSFYVAVYAGQIAQWLYDRMPDKDFAVNIVDVYQYALYHDLIETSSGDTPGPYKRLAIDKERMAPIHDRIMVAHFPGLEWKEPHWFDKAIVKLADCMDEWLHLTVDVRFGNRHVDAIMQDCQDRVIAAVTKLHLVEKYEDELIQICLSAQRLHERGDYQYITDASRGGYG